MRVRDKNACTCVAIFAKTHALLDEKGIFFHGNIEAWRFIFAHETSVLPMGHRIRKSLQLKILYN